MSKIVNIGIIVRNEQGDTFPVALTPQMVSVIQNLLMQIPMMDSKLVDPSGAKVASKESIPIIPREIEFDWDTAYQPMEREKEMELMKKLTEKYAAMSEAESIDGKITQEIDGKEVVINPETGKPAIGEDKLNPFNMTLDATGKANEGMSNAEVVEAMKNEDQKLIDAAKYPDPIAQQEGEENKERQDVTVYPPALPLTGKMPPPNGG